METENAKLIEIIDPQAGEIKETVFTKEPSPAGLWESGFGSMSLKEAATTYPSTFPQLMRQGLKTILFSEYAGLPSTSEGWLKMARSRKADEVWIEGSTGGKIGRVGPGQPIPRGELNLDRSVQITNHKYAEILAIAEESIMFDETNLIMQQVEDLAARMRYTEEDEAYTALRTAASYTRTATAGDNNIGANTATATFGASTLITAMETLTTMKDKHSGRFYGVMPNLLVVGSGIEFAAMQLLLSDQIQRVTGAATAPTNQNIYGTGTTNPFRGVVTSILKTPFLGRYEWVLMQAGKPIVKQVVSDLELSRRTGPNEGLSFDADVLEYKVKKFFGLGMVNDRYAYFSDSTTAPTVD